MATKTINPLPPPPLSLPSSSATIKIHALDTTLQMFCQTAPFLVPPLPGLPHLNFPTYSFLLQHPLLNKTILFDLGGRTDYWNYSPTTLGLIRGSSAGMKVSKNVDQILLEKGYELGKIDAIIWSHGHFDHIGDCSKFPPNVKIIVGEGFKEKYIPGYPTNPNSTMLESDYINHEVIEIPFTTSPLKIGRFHAHDYFSDGSFYLLSVPGHAPGHICGLVRTTPTTFVLLGADTCHLTGCFRPSEFMPMPQTLEAKDGLDEYFTFKGGCPCEMFNELHPSVGEEGTEEEKRTTPWFKASDIKGSVFSDPPTANWSIEGLQEFDASPDIWILLSHDTGLKGVMPLLNDTDEILNDWKAKGCKEATKWSWLNELPRDGKQGRPRIVEGFWRDGVKVATFDG